MPQALTHDGHCAGALCIGYAGDPMDLDRSFVLGLPHDPAACRLAESIIVMCEALGFARRVRSLTQSGTCADTVPVAPHRVKNS
jgi:hypothetical protein